jgi:hypothetical protein
MAVPEATMEEDNFVFLREYKVWAAWQLSYVRAILVPQRANYPGQGTLWSSVFAPYAAHIFASLLWRDVVHWSFLDREIEGKVRDVPEASSFN